MFAKLVASVLLTVLSFFVGIGVMQYGWGLQVQSWGWIIGGFLYTIFALIITTALAQGD